VAKKDVTLVALGALLILALGVVTSELAPAWSVGLVGAAAFAGVVVVVHRHVKRLEDRLADLQGDVTQIEPMIVLSKLIPARRALPPMREYAIAPDFALILFDLVRDMSPKQIVETGSGVSTLVCAYALEAMGGEGKVLALDHDATFAARTRRALEKHGLAHRATVAHAKLVETTVHGRRCLWYAQDALASVGPIDLVMDDGPPKYVGKNARYASLHVLAPKMSRDGLFVLDYVGDEEREIVTRWCKELQFEAEWLATRKGNVILRRKRGDG
jgi:predicted O-methyltransferase YrrM